MTRSLLVVGIVLQVLTGCRGVRDTSTTATVVVSPSTAVDEVTGESQPSIAGVATTSGARLYSTVPFTVCESSAVWVPPTEAEQAANYWDGNPRFASVPRLMLWWAFAQDFVQYHGGASEAYDLRPDFGLWNINSDATWTASAISHDASACSLQPLILGHETELWVRSHRVLNVARSDLSYEVTVVPAPGYQMIRLQGPLSPGVVVEPQAYPVVAIIVVDAGGRVLSTLPQPPWLEAQVGDSPVEKQIAGVVDYTVPGEPGDEMTVTTEDGVVWHLPILSGTVLESASGDLSLHTIPAPGSLVDARGFVASDREGDRRLVAVRIVERRP